jgi:hypothetical protein
MYLNIRKTSEPGFDSRTNQVEFLGHAAWHYSYILPPIFNDELSFYLKTSMLSCIIECKTQSTYSQFHTNSIYIAHTTANAA